MTATPFFILLAAIFIAPHITEAWAKRASLISLSAAFFSLVGAFLVKIIVDFF
jgi:hypothetical protein